MNLGFGARLTLAMLLASPSSLAMAQAASAPSQSAPAEAGAQGAATTVGEVVVTGSHIRETGYARPTPVTVATAQQLQLAAPLDIAQGLNQLPQFAGSTSTASTSATLGQQIGDYLNLRDVGIRRTLILMDGVRVPPTTAQGEVNVDILPQMLVSRVDVVTGGVSAVYGSDAVSGVVNYILDTKFNGIKALAQGGVSDYGDGQSYRLGLALGHGFLDDRLHVLFSAEDERSEQVPRFDRPLNAAGWYTLPQYVPGATEPNGTIAGAAGSANNPLRYVNGVTSSSVAPYGNFLVGPPGIVGQMLTQTGGLTPFVPGSFVVPGNLGQVGGSGEIWPSDRTLIVGSQTDHFFGRISYDVTPNLNVYAQANLSDSIDKFGSAINVVQALIYPNNAFLSPQMQAAFAADPALPFGFLIKIPSDLPLPQQREEVKSHVFQVGFHDDLGGDWAVDGAYVYGHVHENAAESEINQQHLYAAIQSVQTPSGPACLSSITHPGALPGCVPYNPFVANSNSAAAINYLIGQSVYDIINETHDAVLNVSGHIGRTWAGPIGVAFGAEYRHASLTETSNSNPAIPFATTSVGILDVPVPGLSIVTTQPYNITNTGLASGSESVKEGNVELLIPLAKDMAFAKEFSLTGAARYTDYSTSGGVWTWKLGATWQPIEDLRFRVTRSRDIRAPNLYELFAGQTSTRGPVFDIQSNACGQQGCTQQNGIFIGGGGNADLKPELGDTFTAGVVLQPRFARNFRASIDYYDLRIADAITTLSADQIIAECYQSHGTAPACANVTRPGGVNSTQYATSVFAGNINAASWRTKGVDIESSYHLPLSTFSDRLEGALDFRLLANHVSTFTIQNAAGLPSYENAGYAENLLNLGGFDTPLPKWRGTLSALYTQGPFSLFLQERYIGSLRTGGPPNYFAYVQDRLPSVFYTDVTATWDIRAAGGDTQLFLTVNNLLNKQPPLYPNNQVPGLFYPTIQGIYDVMGRYFTMGARLRF